MTTATQHSRNQVYRQGRVDLIKRLGGCCIYCQSMNWGKLEFHHTSTRTWIASRLNRLQRLRMYRAEADAGVIVLACRSCNASMGKPV